MVSVVKDNVEIATKMLSTMIDKWYGHLSHRVDAAHFHVK